LPCLGGSPAVTHRHSSFGGDPNPSSLDQPLRTKHHHIDPRKQMPGGRHQIGIPGRLQVGIGGRLPVGMPGRLPRNPHGNRCVAFLPRRWRPVLRVRSASPTPATIITTPNSSGHLVHSPSCGEEHEKRTEECRDGGVSFSEHHRGTCSTCKRRVSCAVMLVVATGTMNPIASALEPEPARGLPGQTRPGTERSSSEARRAQQSFKNCGQVSRFVVPAPLATCHCSPHLRPGERVG
jgi:uncharacterized protein DUF3761